MNPTKSAVARVQPQRVNLWPSRDQMIKAYSERFGYSEKEAARSADIWREAFKEANRSKK